MDDMGTKDSQVLPQSCRRSGNLEEGSNVQEVVHEVLVKTGEKLDEEPKLGMEFNSEENAYEFYNKYAGKIGFSVRKSSCIKSNDGIVTKKVFCCYKEGRKQKDKRTNRAKYRRPDIRTGCLAKMSIKLQVNGKYSVTKFVAEHNHEVISPSEVHMLRSQRALINAQKARADMADNSGIEFMSRQVGGQENLGSIPVDYKNYLRKKRMKAMEKGDVGAILEYFTKMQVKNPSFFYAMQVDEDDQITNIFWADPKSIMDYSYFGDVVCFDTTYRINSYDRPFAPFIGVNHHKQTVIFGAAFLYDETTESFKWLFETFLNAMSEKQPRTIVTDRIAEMSNAIASVMPGTHHRPCIWHIYQNTAKHLSHVFQSSKGFKYDFSKCLYDCEEEEEFITVWNDMLEKYDLTQNTWLQDLFKERKKWALVYDKNIFCADMKNTQRRENMNHVLKKYLSSKYNLLCFFTHYERIVAERRYRELEADFRMRQSAPILFVDVKMLMEAAKAYTPEVFEIFQNEYKETLNHAIHKGGEFGTVLEFQVIFNDKDEGRLVKFDISNNTVTCSCKKFEFVGILCSHALKVLDYYNIKTLPLHYILKRWQRDAKVGTEKDNLGFTIQDDLKLSSSNRYSYLYRKFVKIASMAAEYEEAFNFADRYSDKFHDELTKCIKGIKELPMMASQTNDESVDTESMHDQSTDNEVNSVDSLSSQTVSGIKMKPRVGGGRRTFKNPLDKGRKKKSRTEFIQPQTNQEGNDSAQAPNIIHLPSFQPSHYPIAFSPLSQVNQGSHVTMMSPFGLSSGAHVGLGHHLVMGYTPGHSGSINAPLAHCGYHHPNINIYQQKSLSIRSHGGFVARGSHFIIPDGSHIGLDHHMVMGCIAGPSGSLNAPSAPCGYQPNINLCQQNSSGIPQLPQLRQESSEGSVMFSQSSSSPSDENQSEV
ncbi:protein FAR1-RELATED SEQUENCE 5-like [Magnolia sinica]|uniref:protein FAR1-RELATED SEQUENCE 5-like n=1 Tax=Magnolia sinica TaxID=86752 RepID=UPI00265825D8|nr:protein FAR1-RELATED SEQUENCE 5-like [Magnolia sinica]XP_058074595.1 protein FAR1-RELATED SEQUENCE 5-like [Magnolia sinica]XP_058074596.1 protein FAR1-RELATED SEQUENCE 5-like [Magnolia sinica]